MPPKTPIQLRSSVRSFNMTPLIDIVFQLIIFFVLVCRFVEAENFPVAVPDGCEFAEENTERQPLSTTVTVMKTADQRCEFAVGSEKITAAVYTDLIEKIAESIDARLKDLPGGGRVVTLRIDKGVYFAQAQYALAALAASSATDVRLAVLKDKNVNSE